MDTTLKNSSPSLTVVMPVYNAGLYLKESIQSILNQSYKDFEFLIINDGSTDNTEVIILSFTDLRIRYLKNEVNKGLIFTLNKAFAECTSDYIVRMDADDLAHKERIISQLGFMEKNTSVAVCGSDYISFNRHKKQYHHSFHTHDSIHAHMLFNSSIAHPTVIIRRECLKNIKPVFDAEYLHAEDYHLWSQLIKSYSFASINKPLLYYRIHPNQISDSQRWQQVKSANKIRALLLKQQGINCTERELELHCIIGSSIRIRKVEDLKDAAEFLQKLLKYPGKIDTLSFNKVIAKTWYDTCGNTSLGLKAYFIYLRSNAQLKKRKADCKLFLKCILRRFK